MSTHPDQEGKIRVGITSGDINGIGLEVMMKTFLDNRMLQVCTPVIYASAKTVSLQRKLLGLNEFNYNTIRNAGEMLMRKVNVVNCWDEDIAVNFGTASPLSGQYSLRSLENAVTDLAAKKIDVLVTAPINKHSIHSEQFKFSGHTEYLAQKFQSKDFLMFMLSENLRVAIVSGHVPVKNVNNDITTDKILRKLKLIHQSLKRDFGISKPRIAVLGLNPHAGDSGLIGNEEQEIILPAVKKANEENIFVMGPYSADGFFGSAAYNKFDAILAMYHDQGLIPFKALSFTSGVNYTAGLSVVRTSPDHGTAYDIAGKNKANESSFREAVYMACDIFLKREEYDSITANPLKFSKMGLER